MRQLRTWQLIDWILVVLFVIGVVGYVASTGVPAVSAISQVSPGMEPDSAAFQTGNQLVVVAFSDTTGAGPFECQGCDKIYSSADRDANSQNLLPGMEFVVHNAATGEELGRQQAEQQPQGRYRAIFQLPGDLQDDVVLSLVAAPAGFQLCPNASASRTISSSNFVLGTHEEVYPFWTGCPLETEPTATSVPSTPRPSTPTPRPPTPTPEPTATPLPERSIVVEAFVDVTGPGGLDCPGCDLIFSSSDQSANASDPLPNLDFVLREADTSRIRARQTTTMDSQGRTRTRFTLPAGFDQTVIVELASVPSGYQLCPNMTPSRMVEPTDFILGTHLEQFSFWKGCELQETAPEPSPTATPAPISSPTSAPTVVVAPSPTQPLLSLPEGALSAVVTARGLNVRFGPGVEYGRVGAVGGGTELFLSGRDESGSWVRGRAPEENLEGWLSARYLDIDGDVMSLPVAGLVATPTLPPVDMLRAIVTARGLNVRTGPGVEFARVDAVAGGTKLVLDGRDESASWVHGRAPEEDIEGWLSASYMDVDGDVKSLPVLGPAGEMQVTPTEPAVTPTPAEMPVPERLPDTGGFGDMPLWGLLAMASAILLALSHIWRWAVEVRAS